MRWTDKHDGIERPPPQQPIRVRRYRARVLQASMRCHQRDELAGNIALRPSQVLIDSPAKRVCAPWIPRACHWGRTKPRHIELTVTPSFDFGLAFAHVG